MNDGKFLTSTRSFIFKTPPECSRPGYPIKMTWRCTSPLAPIGYRDKACSVSCLLPKVLGDPTDQRDGVGLPNFRRYIVTPADQDRNDPMEATTGLASVSRHLHGSPSAYFLRLQVNIFLSVVAYCQDS